MYICVCVHADLEVDLEELVAQKHHPPLLRVLDAGSTEGPEQHQGYTGPLKYSDLILQ